MYCRECGNKLSENAVSCSHCGTNKNEGANYCQNCGFHTTVKTDFCANCGAKQKTIIPQKVKNAQKVVLQKQLKFNQTWLRIERIIAVLGIVSAVVLFAVLILRPEPDNIPDPSNMYISPNTFIHDAMHRIGNSYYYDDSYISQDVAEYWVQGRELILCIVLSLFISVSAFINSIFHKHKCKKIKKNLER